MPFLNTPLDQALNSTSKIRILRLLLQNDLHVSGREASRLTDTTLPAVQAALDDLVKQKLVVRRTTSNGFQYLPNRNNLLLAGPIASLFEFEARWRYTVRSELHDAIHRAATNQRSKIICAWISGRAEPGDKLNLMILTADASWAANAIAPALSATADRIGIDIQPTIISENDLSTHRLRLARVVWGLFPSTS
ncbi:MAG TPA: hypothetical protein VF042_14385 [Gemmatimonadaceae bacterium]